MYEIKEVQVKGWFGKKTEYGLFKNGNLLYTRTEKLKNELEWDKRRREEEEEILTRTLDELRILKENNGVCIQTETPCAYRVVAFRRLDLLNLLFKKYELSGIECIRSDVLDIYDEVLEYNSNYFSTDDLVYFNVSSVFDTYEEAQSELTRWKK